ncbi:hypothetical protein [Flagellimonas meridianipacifica]|uniref:Spy/CpxP family protein refolding chaperone n=1 Tax=Flagellimonas meridianipacifica TaxID=1080225 RepID=A0A2T0MEN1_9FLAO|nr:hypothetical protein [Allomuricauda pacifica]PRX56031.1 hypothetical protein CLV81_0019 [Allomuricauda pacifica]
MKQLVVLLMILTSISAFSQRPDGQKRNKGALQELSVEQLATLHTKKLTLALDLTESQQAKIMEISLEEAAFKKTRHEEFRAKKESGEWKKPTADERFEIASARLDRKIAHQQKMKEILNKEQYHTWKELNLKRAMNGKKVMQREGRRG